MKGESDKKRFNFDGKAAGVVIPLVTIFSAFLTPEKEIWGHLAATLLPDLLTNTLKLSEDLGFATEVELFVLVSDPKFHSGVKSSLGQNPLRPGATPAPGRVVRHLGRPGPAAQRPPGAGCPPCN